MYKTKYKIPFTNPGVPGISGSEHNISILIQERGYIGAETTLKGDSHVGVLRYLNNEEEKYPTILPSELDIRFYSENNFSLEEIITDDDYQYRVLVAFEDIDSSHIVWSGFLVTDDCSEEMQSDPKLIILKANDGLGALKNITLYNIDVYEMRTPAGILLHCLDQTQNLLDKVWHINIFESSMNNWDADPNANPLHHCKVHSRSFLDSQMAYGNCYDAMEAILKGFGLSLFQQDGRWVIMRKHDFWNSTFNKGVITPADGYEEYQIAIDYKVDINQKNIIPINAGHLKGYTGVSSYTDIKYTYKVPAQLPRNSNFLIGSRLLIVALPDWANTISGWRYEEVSGTPVSLTPYLYHRIDPDTGNEIEAFVVLPRKGTGTWEYVSLKSTPVEVSYGDKLNISGEYRTTAHIEGYSYAIMHIILYGKDGSTWTLRKNVNNMAYNEDAVWRNTAGQEIMISFSSEDESENWLSFNIQSPTFPVDGEIQIWLYNTAPGTSTNRPNFKDLKFTWDLFYNNEFGQTGEKDTLKKTGNYKSKISSTISVGNAPKKTISGALFKTNGKDLLGNWYRYGKTESERLIRLNNLAQYQSSHRLYTKIDGDFLGISYLRDYKRLLGPANIFRFTAIPDKYYLATSLELSLGSNTFITRLAEFYDTSKDNDDPQAETKNFQFLYE